MKGSTRWHRPGSARRGIQGQTGVAANSSLSRVRGAKKYELEQTIAPGEQMWVNVAELIRNRVADRNGYVLPAEITSGTYDVQHLTPGPGSLLPGSMTSDSTWGNQVRGGSVDCCGDAGSSYEPGSFNIVMGDPDNPFVIDGINQCTGATDNLTNLFTSFWSSNNAIATVTKGNISPIAPGDTFANASGEVWYCQGDTGGWEKEYPTAPVTVTPEIQFQGNTINGKTQSVVVGQQIALTAVYNPPSGLTVKSRQWTVGGTTVGGFNTGNTNGGSTTATLTNDAATFYWVTLGNSLNVGFTVTFSDNSTASALTKFNVAGPSSPSVVTKVGTINTLNNTKLVLGGSGSNIGIEFTPSASAPSGYSNTWVYVQLIDSLTIKLITGNTVTCTGSGLDGTYPYLPATGTYTDDNPGVMLKPAYSEESDQMAAHMYVMWSSGLANSIPVPLGYVSWNWFGDATYNSQNGLWTVQPSSSVSAAAFQESSAYASWTTDYPAGSTCP